MSSLTPHGPGFSFLDAFMLGSSPQSGRGTKWLDPKLGFFQDHFPGKPLMPAVLLVECAAQAAGALWASIQGPQAPVHFVLAQVLQFKILRPVLPGETVVSQVTFTTALGSLAQFDVVLSVDNDEVARGRIVLGAGPDAEKSD